MTPDPHAEALSEILAETRSMAAETRTMRGRVDELHVEVLELRHGLFGVREHGGVVHRVAALEARVEKRGDRADDRAHRRRDLFLAGVISFAVAIGGALTGITG